MANSRIGELIKNSTKVEQLDALTNQDIQSLTKQQKSEIRAKFGVASLNRLYGAQRTKILSGKPSAKTPETSSPTQTDLDLE